MARTALTPIQASGAPETTTQKLGRITYRFCREFGMTRTARRPLPVGTLHG